MEPFNLPGLIPDPRTEEQKSKDFQHSEVAPTAVVLNWNRDMSGAPVYSTRSQNGSGTCVEQGSAKAWEVLTGVVQSAHPGYARRKNFPSEGMWLQDAGDIMNKQGTTTEVLDPSQNMTEAQMNAPVTVQTPYKGLLYFFVDVMNIDAIATAIELYKQCLVTINVSYPEYASSVKPVMVPGAKIDGGHCICGVYYFTDENGEKCILIDESWGPNNITRRVLTESFLKGRGTGAMYYLPPAPTPNDKPVYDFKTALAYGETNNDVIELQNCLKYEGLFPSNVPSTGYYGNLTAKAVLAFQLKYKLEDPATLNSLGGKHVGPLSLKKLNELYFIKP